jgi:hypothetical protein
MEVTRPRLLIVGDSFFSTDAAFPGQHWSEMLPNYEVMNCAYPGNSNGIIQVDLLNGLAQKPDAVVIGFTEAGRIEFENPNADVDRRWITTQHHKSLTSDQKLLSTLSMALLDNELRQMQAFWQILGTLYFLKSSNIPFLYSLGIYDNHTRNIEEFMPTNKKFLLEQLDQFKSHAIDLNLATYPMELQKSFDPLFHVPDPVWQSGFANEVITKLKTLDI